MKKIVIIILSVIVIVVLCVVVFNYNFQSDSGSDELRIRQLIDSSLMAQKHDIKQDSTQNSSIFMAFSDSVLNILKIKNNDKIKSREDLKNYVNKFPCEKINFLFSARKKFNINPVDTSLLYVITDLELETKIASSSKLNNERQLFYERLEAMESDIRKWNDAMKCE